MSPPPRRVFATVHQGAGALRAALDAEARAGRRLVVVDAMGDEDLRIIGAAVAGNALVTGGSGIALGLPDNFRAAGLLGTASPAVGRVRGPGLVLSGSCSAASLEQVARYRQRHPGLAIDPAALVDGRIGVAAALDWVRGHWHAAPIVHSTAEPDAVADAQARNGREALARTIEDFFGQLAVAAVCAGVTRLAVGGGETSGAVVTALDLGQLHIGPEIAAGVPALAANGPRALRLALKSGNFGGPDFYNEALDALGTP